MENYMNFLAALLLLFLISSARATYTIPLTNEDIIAVAIEEMDRANYYTFVMMLNMVPSDHHLIHTNVTFLMPKDPTLAKTVIPANEVVDFLLRHSIPSPLLFDHLQHLPTGSLLPTSMPQLMLNVTNNGRQRFFLNNVRITSPNICTRGSSIRCHGIDGVLEPTNKAPSFPNGTTPRLKAPLPSPSPSILPPPPPFLFDANSNNITTAGASPPPPPTDDSDVVQQKSGSQHTRYAGFYQIITTCQMLIVVKLSVFEYII